jgi:hypothetical protein
MKLPPKTKDQNKEHSPEDVSFTNTMAQKTDDVATAPRAEKRKHYTSDSERDTREIVACQSKKQKVSDKENHIPGHTTSEDELDCGELRHCPGAYCQDEIPAATDCSDELTHVIDSYQTISRAKGRKVGWCLAGEVCSLLRINAKELAMVEDALGHGWPVTLVDFREIPG